MTEYEQAAKKGWDTRRKNGNAPTHDQRVEWGRKGGLAKARGTKK